MVKVGDLVRCPKCGKYSRVVWVSKDGQTAGVRCSSRHRFTPRRNLLSTPTNREDSRFEKNMVFLVSI
jgi:hypothetical protein